MKSNGCPRIADTVATVMQHWNSGRAQYETIFDFPYLNPSWAAPPRIKMPDKDFLGYRPIKENNPACIVFLPLQDSEGTGAYLM